MSDIENKAIAYAKANKKHIAKSLTSKTAYASEDAPVSVFMAGSPGAGKTESAKLLIESLSGPESVLRIDLDEYRSYFDDYDGRNSSLFQYATSIIADKVHDLALKNSQSFIFDGTLTNLDRVIDNIKRSLKRKRFVFIVYVYQDPIQAWEFVKKRAEKDGRVIPKEVFIKQYFLAHENVNKIKKMFTSKVQVDLVVKNIDGTDFRYKENITSIDSHLKEKYSKEELSKLIL